MAHKPTNVNPKLKRKRREERFKINMTSMMDIFTIILVFLLKSYSAEGALITPAEGLKLPNSTVDKNAKVSLSVAISRAYVTVEEKPVIRTADILDQIKNDPSQYLVDALYADLQQRADLAKKMEADYGTAFSGEVTVQIDEEIPFELLTRILYTCGQASWSNMKLVVYTPSAG
jgi:biopolymer transport protein ExbD